VKRILLIVALVPVALAAAWGASFLRERLAPGPALTVRSEPSASVYLNGEYRGVTPLHIGHLEAGDYVLRLSRAGYRDARRAVTVSGHEAVALDLQARPDAHLLVTSAPAGAVVYIDGVRHGRTPLKLEDLEPGAHNVELLLANYLPARRTLNLDDGAEESVAFELEHRQVRAYRARLEADPYDIGAYNDLGELLYVLERYDEAAETYVRGFIAAGSGHEFSHRAQQNLRRLAGEPRARHGHPEFRHALDHRIFAALKEGETSRYLLDDFKRIPWSQYPEAYAAALEGLIGKNSDNAKLAVEVAQLFRNMNRFDRAIELLDQAIAKEAEDFDIVMAAVELMLDILEGRDEKPARQALDRYLGKASALATKPPRQTEFLFAQGRRDLIDGKFEEGAKRCREAIDQQKRTNTANEWRVYLARQYKKQKQLEPAADLLLDVLDTGKNRSAAFRQARQLIRAMPKELRTRKK
jgi:tetratricopeptide (TPR) repeat protein